MVMHMIRSDSPAFQQFGEGYFSITNPGVTKGWKIHREMTQNFAVPAGTIRLVLFDDRPDSPSRGSVNEFELGINAYKRVTIPAKIWYSFKAISPEPAMIANCASHPHDPSEVETKDLHDTYFPYSWS